MQGVVVAGACAYVLVNLLVDLLLPLLDRVWWPRPGDPPGGPGRRFPTAVPPSRPGLRR